MTAQSAEPPGQERQKDPRAATAATAAIAPKPVAQKTTLAAAGLTVVATILAAASSIYTLPSFRSSSTATDMKELAAQLERIDRQINAPIAVTATNTTSSSLLYGRANTRIDHLDTRLASIENSMRLHPEETVQVVLLKSDIEHITDKISELKSSIGLLWAIVLALFAVSCAVAFASIAPIVDSFMSRRGK